jgi:hypothetical protein
MPIVLKSGSLNLLEPSGTVKACNGNALPAHINKHALLSTILDGRPRGVVVTLFFLFLFFGAAVAASDDDNHVDNYV